MVEFIQDWSKTEPKFVKTRMLIFIQSELLINLSFFEPTSAGLSLLNILAVSGFPSWYAWIWFTRQALN